MRIFCFDAREWSLFLRFGCFLGRASSRHSSPHAGSASQPERQLSPPSLSLCESRALAFPAMEPLRGVVQTYEWGMRDTSCQVRSAPEALHRACAVTLAALPLFPTCAARLCERRGCREGWRVSVGDVPLLGNFC